MYGGETKIVYSEQATSCLNVDVNVDATKEIHFTNENVREYDLVGCDFKDNSSLYQDSWICECPEQGFELILSVLPNTINTYTFELVFNFESEEDVIGTEETVTVTRRGSRICSTEWNCTEWSECSPEGIQTRTCSFPEGFCEPIDLKPAEIQSCVYQEFQEIGEEETFEEELEIQGFFATMTGAVIGVMETPGGRFLTMTFILLIIIMLALIIPYLRKRRKDQ